MERDAYVWEPEWLCADVPGDEVIESNRCVAEHRDELLAAKLDRANSVLRRCVGPNRKLETYSLGGEHFDEKVEWLPDEHGIRSDPISHLHRQLRGRLRNLNRSLRYCLKQQ